MLNRILAALVLLLVKPEMLNQWRTLQQKDVMPALKKSGVATRKVYHTVVGENNEFISCMPFPHYSEMDGPDTLIRHSHFTLSPGEGYSSLEAT